MVSEKESYDWDVGFEDANFKSCFARSVVVNSHHKLTKKSEPQQLQTDYKRPSEEISKQLSSRPLPPVGEPIVEDVKLRKVSSLINVKKI